MTCPSCGASNEPTAEVCFSCRTVLSAVSRGTVLASRYEIRELVGRGGMGTVYRARDLVLDEEVAIKVLRADVAQAQGMAERFLSEIKLARRVSHPNVCRIHEYGEEGALRFISMELVNGKSLKELLQANPLPAPQAFDVAEQAARGLMAIHEVGIVHRDLKPANLTLDEAGRVRVMDFGIAKAAGKAGDTTAGYHLGSPEYMSPEQARGRGADFRSDLYSLGIVVFELFVGRPPFRADTPVGTLLLQIEAPPPLETHADLIPASLVPVLRRALAKDPAGRYASARALAEGLHAAAEASQGGARSEGRAASSLRSSSRGRRRWALVPVTFLAVVGVVWTYRSLSPDRSPSRTAPEPPASMPTPAAEMPAASPPAVSPPPSMPRSDQRAHPAAAERQMSIRPSPGAPSPTPPPSPTPAPAIQGAAVSSPAIEPPERNPSAPAEAQPDVQGKRPPSEAQAVAPGFLLVVVSPWADVAIDGQPAGQTPLGRITLSPGAHTVRLSHPAFQPYPRRVMVRSGETTKLSVDLAQDGVRIVR